MRTHPATAAVGSCAALVPYARAVRRAQSFLHRARFSSFQLFNIVISLAGALALVLAAGCMAPIGATRVSPRQAYLDLHQNALNSSHYSDDAAEVLHRYDLEKEFKDDPDAAFKQLQDTALRDGRRDVLYALCELNYFTAARVSRSVKPWEPRQARDYYFTCAIYAYLYLLGESEQGRPNPFDRRIRAACEFYNRGLALGLIVKGNTNALVELSSGQRQTLPGSVEVQYTQPGFPLPVAMIAELYSADEFIVRGLTVRNRNSGLGAPLIAVSHPQGEFQEQRRVPVTVFLRLDGDLRAWSAGTLKASLELYSGFETRQVEVNGRPVPLQTDTTAPIAHGLNNSAIWKLGFAQFFSSEERVKTGVRLMQPYVPGRIPVVFVHGTASSPVWWAEMWNTLTADPVLRKRYQFWMFNYASGNPITYSASLLRNGLLSKIHDFDPEGKDPALRQMVIIGHSQGGLLAKLTATDTGDKIWKLTSDKSIDDLNVDVRTRELLRTNLFFTPLPCVKRVVFIATPHRGSYKNSPFVQALLRPFMSLRKELVTLSSSWLKAQEQLRLPKAARKGIPTSLTGMATDNPFMLTLADIPVAPGIKANSIIAIQGNAQPPKGADGVVTYTSAHVDYAESEFIVRSFHSCQDKPPTIEEVRRILLEHLRGFSDQTPRQASASGPVSP